MPQANLDRQYLYSGETYGPGKAVAIPQALYDQLLAIGYDPAAPENIAAAQFDTPTPPSTRPRLRELSKAPSGKLQRNGLVK